MKQKERVVNEEIVQRTKALKIHITELDSEIKQQNDDLEVSKSNYITLKKSLKKNLKLLGGVKENDFSLVMWLIFFTIVLCFALWFFLF